MLNSLKRKLNNIRMRSLLFILVLFTLFLGAFQNCGQSGDIGLSAQRQPSSLEVGDSGSDIPQEFGDPSIPSSGPTSGSSGGVGAPSVPMAEVPKCQAVTASAVQPKLLYAWDYSQDNQPDYKQVMAAPVVGDLDGDKQSEIVFVSYLNGGYSKDGVLRVLQGSTGMPKFSIDDPELKPAAATTPLIVDLDHDGKAEIIYLHYLLKSVVALNFDGTFRWKIPLGQVNNKDLAISSCYLGFAAADLLGDGKTSILASNFIITEDSQRKPSILRRFDTSTEVCSSFAASLDTTLGSQLRILNYAGVFDNTGEKIFSFLREGTPAVGELMPEVPGLEVVVTSGGFLTIYNGLTGAVLLDKNLKEHSSLTCLRKGLPVIGGGQASLGDFDGNPKNLEIAIATGRSLTIFDNKGEILAGQDTQDCSSLVTGITSFDFNGDGKPEIIYGDEKYVRIYEMDGTKDLKVIWEELNPSGTLREYPVVADLDGSGSAKLIVVANNMWATPEMNSLGFTEKELEKSKNITGLRVFGPQTANSWMPTRALWNQHAYFVSNVLDNLQATASTISSVFFGGSFKRNVQNGMFDSKCKK